jgi:MIP family channel proteins
MAAAETRRKERPAWSRLGAEVFGTFALTFTACAVEIVAASHAEISHAERALASALTVIAVIYAVSDVSGAHINPAVTLAFTLRRAFDWRRLPEYWAAQFGGALAGAGLARLLLGGAALGGATVPKLGAGRALAVEAALTFLLVSVIIHTSKRKGAVGPQAALAVGATIAVSGFWAGPLTGASMNPARSFGPAVFAGQLGAWWIYAVGAALGAAIAVPVARLIHGPPSESEERAAEGES